jgi:hypothetical protein
MYPQHNNKINKENSLEVLQKIKYRTTKWTSSPSCVYMSEVNKLSIIEKISVFPY